MHIYVLSIDVKFAARSFKKMNSVDSLIIPFMSFFLMITKMESVNSSAVFRCVKIVTILYTVVECLRFTKKGMPSTQENGY